MNETAEVRVSPGLVGDKFDTHGCQIFPSILCETDCDLLSTELTRLFETQQHNSRSRIGGVRNLLRLSPQVSQLATSECLVSLVEQLTGRRSFPVRAIFFDKTAESNWRVPWHQDLTIAVTCRVESPGFGTWSVKEGIVHVQPPLGVLQNMVAIRLHFDDCNESNGALRVIPGSHLDGELDANQIGTLTSSGTSVTCEVTKGGVLALRPLLLHASSPATSPSHRRVLHIEYACDDLPDGLQWHDR